MIKSLDPILRVANVRRSLAFYRDVLGFDVAVEMPGPDGELIHGEARSGSVSIMFGPPMSADDPIGGGATLYITLDGVDAFAERLRAAGATLSQPLTDQFWGHRTCAVRDPDGYELMFAEVVRAMSDAEQVAAARELVATPA